MRSASTLQIFGLTAICALATACGNSQLPVDGALSPTDPSSSTSPTLTTSATATATGTAPSTVTVSATATGTQADTASAVTTASQTNTQTNTQTITQTASQTATVTFTQPGTQTSTQTATSSRVELGQGNYSGEACYLDLLASLSAGRDLYSLASYRFGEKGKGSYSFSLFVDSACRSQLSKNRVNLTYSTATYFDRLLLISVEQPIDPKNNVPFTHYWIAALKDNENLLLDIDAAQGARGPYISQPNESELRAAMEGLERRAVVFQKNNRRSATHQE